MYSMLLNLPNDESVSINDSGATKTKGLLKNSQTQKLKVQLPALAKLAFKPEAARATAAFASTKTAPMPKNSWVTPT